jgi:glutamate-1-semialdehyde 2,1-aminomutase
MTILETYRRRNPRSAALFERAGGLVPGGLTHDARFAPPFPLYVERSAGARKWTADGQELIDYWMGHGALLLGHGHPAIAAAVQQQMERGTHYGAEHELTLVWSDLVRSLFPGIERLRFTASGTEATAMALRLARAFTGRPAVIRFLGHYHGWHDGLAYGMDGDLTPPAGIPGALLEATIPLPADLEAVARMLRARDDIAAVILEPTGASYGMSPLPPGFLAELRRLTAARDVLLICDEVVTGFRVAPGGEQQRAGVTADLTTLAKILCGGLPGGAVGGRAAIMARLQFGDAAWNQAHKVRHNGTFNANPLSAAAGVAVLREVATGAPGARAADLGRRLVAGLNDVLRERRLRGWAAYGDGSIFHVLAASAHDFPPGELPDNLPLAELKAGGGRQTLTLLRMALVNHGVDWMRGRSGFLSAAHTEADVAATVAAFAAAVDDLAAERGRSEVV